MAGNFRFDETITFKELCDSYIEIIPGEEEYNLSVEYLMSTLPQREGKTLAEIKSFLDEDVKDACWNVILYNIKFFIGNVSKTYVADSIKSDFLEYVLEYAFDAALKCDFNKAKYITFASNYFQKAKANYSLVLKNGLSENIKYTEITHKVWKVYEDYKDEFGSEPTMEELADILGIKRKTVIEHINHMRCSLCASIDELVESDGNFSSLGDIILDHDDSRSPVQRAEVLEQAYEEFYDSLPEEDRNIYELHMGIGDKNHMPNTKISNKTGLPVDEIIDKENNVKMLINDFFKPYGYEIDYKNNEIVS